MTRRRLLGLLPAAAVAACAPEPGDTARRSPPPTTVTSSPSSSPSPSTSPPPEPADEPTPQPPAAEPYEPLPGDVYADAKRVGGRFVQALTTYEAGAGLDDVAVRAAEPARPGLDPTTLAPAARPLHHPGVASTGEVVYVQLGGLHPASAPTTASTMVVVLQRVVTADGEQAQTRTVDARVRLVDGRWVVDGLGDVGGIAVQRPADLSAAARTVLDDERIDLPDSARWDIHRGDIDPRLLSTMATMADRFPYSVTCLKSGHPRNVFGTDRRSNHTAGRGVDVWAVDDVPVVEQQPQVDTPAHTLTRALFEAGMVPELGAPWAFDGRGGRSFQNDVHRDHLHVAFYA